MPTPLDPRPLRRPHRGPVPSAVAALTLALALGLLLAGCTADAGDPGSGSGTAPAGAASEGSPDDVLATVGGEEVTRGEVEASAGQALERVENQRLQCQTEADQQRHQILENETRKMVRERLLAAEAEERGLTQEELLQSEVQSRVGEVTPAEVDAFYQQNQGQIRAPKEQVAGQIAEYLRQARASEAYEGFMRSLEEEADVSYDLGPYRVEIATEGEPAAGPEDAPVTIVEFSDFECPYCSRVVPTLKRVQEEYGDRVRLVFKQYPLPNHAQAQKAGEASLCAHDQGKFWELHDAMFADQQNLGPEALVAKAERLGLDVTAFRECLQSGRYADAVQEDLREGARAGVSGTPAMFVNGRLVSGAVPYEEIARVIDEELERRGGRS
ncbi:MAG TPA: thioredoxin domain-containing protein [Thermoanaerobaculia bacterium]|nr:thioredoxin domain-containing protein [Thermoanaerobaculia bacterium]